MSRSSEKSRSATIAVSLSGAVASTSPQGSTIAERPPDRNPPGCEPIWLAPITKLWVSIARARSNSSQWSRVVGSVNAAGTAITCAPSAASAW